MERVFVKINRFFRHKWQLAVLDLNRGRWIVESKVSNIPYLKAENANGRHILIRPTQIVEPYYMMADDLDRSLLCRHHRHPDGSWKPGRMVVETSPGNFQVWIHSSRFLQLEEKRHWLVKMRSDPGADPKNRWGRCPGFRNRKKKYRNSEGHHPLSRLIWVDWKNEAAVPVLSPQPEGGVCRKRRISRDDYCRGNESETDFAYSLALARKGFSDAEIVNRLLNERSNWDNHKNPRQRSDYLARTVSRARNIVSNS